MHSLDSIIDQYGGLIQTGPFGSQLKQAEYTDQGVPVVMPKDISAGTISIDEIARVSETKADQLARHFLKPGSIVFPRRGDIGKCALITENEDGFLCGTGCIKIELPKEQLDPQFFYYYLIQPNITEWLERNAIGSTMLNLNTSIIGRIQVPDIGIAKQKAIAFVLKTYDSLIENNRRRIQLLEDSARLLYREWFVHLRFPGHEHVKIVDGVPEGWKSSLISNLLSNVKRKVKIKKEDYHESGLIPCIDQSRDFIGGYTDNLSAAITDDLPVVVFGDHTRIVKFVDFPFAPGADGTQILTPKDKSIPRIFFYFLISSADVANAFYARHFKFLKAKETLIPPENLMERFESLVQSNMAQITKLREYNRKLTQARDLLLPRLMSGEISV